MKKIRTATIQHHKALREAAEAKLAALEEAVRSLEAFSRGAVYPIKMESLIDAIRSLKTPADKD